MSYMGAIVRVHEKYEVASSTWYTLGLFVTLQLFPFREACLGIVALGAGDPMAGLIGRMFGQIHVPGTVRGCGCGCQCECQWGACTRKYLFLFRM